MIENAVPIADVARVMKLPVADVRDSCRDLQLFVGQDWAGRPAVSVQDAAGLVSGDLVRDKAYREAWDAHQRATSDWEAARETARQNGYRNAWLAAKSRGAGDPEAGSEGRLAGAEAAEGFELANPAPTFNGTSTAQSWLRRTADRLAEALS